MSLPARTIWELAIGNWEYVWELGVVIVYFTGVSNSIRHCSTSAVVCARRARLAACFASDALSPRNTRFASGMAVGDIPTAYGMSPWISILLGSAILLGVLYVFGKREDPPTVDATAARS